MITWFTYFALTSPLIPLSIFLFRKVNWNRTVIAIVCLLGLNIFMDYFSLIMWKLGSPSFTYFEIYSLPLSWIVFEIYRGEIKKEGIKRLIRVAQILFTVFALYQFSDMEESYNELPYSLLSVMIIMLSIYFFYYTFIRMEVSNLEEYPLFWVNSAILIYFGGTLFISLFENVMRDAAFNVVGDLWRIQNSAAIIFNCIMAKGIWEMKKI